MFSGSFETPAPAEAVRTDCELTSSPWPALRPAGPAPTATLPLGGSMPCDCFGGELGPTLYR